MPAVRLQSQFWYLLILCDSWLILMNFLTKNLDQNIMISIYPDSMKVLILLENLNSLTKETWETLAAKYHISVSRWPWRRQKINASQMCAFQVVFCNPEHRKRLNQQKIQVSGLWFKKKKKLIRFLNVRLVIPAVKLECQLRLCLDTVFRSVT